VPSDSGHFNVAIQEICVSSKLNILCRTLFANGIGLGVRAVPKPKGEERDAAQARVAEFVDSAGIRKIRTTCFFFLEPFLAGNSSSGFFLHTEIGLGVYFEHKQFSV
jgi:hypothetical protein